MNGFEQTIGDCTKSLMAYFGKRGYVQKARIWLDAYVPTDSSILMLNKFERAFGEDPFLFGVSVDNVRQFAEVSAGLAYHNEAFIKSTFISEILTPNAHIVGYEFPIGDNRVDLCALDSRSVAFEIKTAYDKLDRLNKQLSSYLRAFEYVYVVVEKGKLGDVFEIAPECVGIYSYSDSARKLKFTLRRCARHSKFLDEDFQKDTFPSALAESDDVNNAFKNTIQKKYKKNWAFLKANMERLSMLDYQASFRLCRCF